MTRVLRRKCLAQGPFTSKDVGPFSRRERLFQIKRPHSIELQHNGPIQNIKTLRMQSSVNRGTNCGKSLSLGNPSGSKLLVEKSEPATRVLFHPTLRSPLENP